VLQVASLSKRYGHLAALSEVSFAIPPREVLGVIGPNGSGKTTLFECLGGVLPADTGGLYKITPGTPSPRTFTPGDASPPTFTPGDASPRNARPLTPAERVATVFYLPDSIAPWPEQTVRWALDFTVGYFGSAGTGSHAAAPHDVIERLDLEPLLDSRIGTLSKGQRKRALLAVGLLTPQPLLLADEPFEGLDLRQTREIAQTLRHYAAAGRTMVLSIHQISDAARVCDRFVLLSGGRTRGEGTLDDLARLAAPRAAAGAGRDLEEIFLALT
jgi:ABC-2 type transport system ATP-binding protein